MHLDLGMHDNFGMHGNFGVQNKFGMHQMLASKSTYQVFQLPEKVIKLVTAVPGIEEIKEVGGTLVCSGMCKLLLENKFCQER